MVSFSCETCGDVFTNKKLDAHHRQCQGSSFTCLDCMTHLRGTDVRTHTSCVSEDQKYQGALYKEKPAKQAKKFVKNEDLDLQAIDISPKEAELKSLRSHGKLSRIGADSSDVLTTGPPMLQAQQHSYFTQTPYRPQSYFTQNPYGLHSTQLQQPFQPPLEIPPQQQLLATQPQPPPQASSPPSRKRMAPESMPIAAISPMSSKMPSTCLSEPYDGGQQAEEANEMYASMPLPKKGRINIPWTPAEEQRLKIMRDAGNSWGEIAKTFSNRTEGNVKKHWYKDMHYADFAEDDSAALLAAIKEYEASKWEVIGKKVGKPANVDQPRHSASPFMDADDQDNSAALLVAIKEYEASKWKVIGQKVGKPAKACELYAKENYPMPPSPSFTLDNSVLSSLLQSRDGKKDGIESEPAENHDGEDPKPMIQQQHYPPGQMPQIYTAVYSSISVYEMEVNQVTVMRRRKDSWFNATQILKVAGIESEKRKKVLEKEVFPEEHEKVQGGYGKYQGTWISHRRGVEFARQYGVEALLRPLFEYDMGSSSLIKRFATDYPTPMPSICSLYPRDGATDGSDSEPDETHDGEDSSTSNERLAYPTPMPTYPPQMLPSQALDKSVRSSIPQSEHSGGRADTRSSSTKRHKCPYCSMDFTRHHNLKSHLLTHSQEKLYQCDTCKARFRRLHDLKRHTKLHTGERRHTCPLCNRSFARSDSLARHSMVQCAGRRSIMSSFGGDENNGERISAGDEDGMPAKVSNDSEHRNEETGSLLGGVPSSLLQDPDMSVKMSSDISIASAFAYPAFDDEGVLHMGPPMTVTALTAEENGEAKQIKTPPSDDSMWLVQSQVLDGLLGSKAGRASLAMEWDLLGFMESQYPENDNAMLGSVITLTGSALCAQAMTCSEYVRHTWPLRGAAVLTAFQHAIDSHRHKAKGVNTDIDINIDLTQGACVLEVTSEKPNIVAETFQVAIWMGAALQISRNERTQNAHFDIDSLGAQTSSENAKFSVRFSTYDLSAGEQSCWLPLFSNPSIAQGFPVRQRENAEKGLEIPVEIMAALGGARHVTEFEGGLVLKGYSAIDEDRILYGDLRDECSNRTMLDEVDQESLRTTRAFLGWWKSAETHLGTADAAYDGIGWSPASESRRSARFSGANIGFQTMITGQLNFIMGAKDGRLHFSQKGPFQRIVQCADTIPVALYDHEDRRAWFVPALNVMLHILRTRHHMSPFKIDGKDVKLSPVDPGRYECAAAEAIAANQSRLLYERDPVSAEKDYYFRDAILDIWSQMERLMEKEDSMGASSGLALHGTMQSKLRGWEFMSLVHEKNFRQKEVTISKSSGGWVDLINDIDGLVLFATGFEEIIRPVSDIDNLCRRWRSLPTGKDYLAAGIPILELLYSEAGSRHSRKHLSSNHLQWHRGSTLFEQCSSTTSHRCDCDRTQQIYHDSLLSTFGRVRPPGDLEENGCVIFGQAHHPFQPRKSVAIRHNAVHMLPNTSIQNDKTTMQTSTRDDGMLSPSPPASFSPECEEVNGYATWSLKRSSSPPLSLSDDLVQEETVAPKRRRKMSQIQPPKFEPCKKPNNGNDQKSLSDGCAICPAEYQLMLKHNTQSKEQCLVSTQNTGDSEAEYAPVHTQKTVRRKAKIEDYSHRHGCSCATCSIVDFEPPDSIDLVRNTNGTRRNSTNILERREATSMNLESLSEHSIFFLSRRH